MKSVLHYDGRACWKGSTHEPTLTHKETGQNVEGLALRMMSPIDQIEINRFYSCPDQETFKCKKGDDFVILHERCDGIGKGLLT